MRAETTRERHSIVNTDAKPLPGRQIRKAGTPLLIVGTTIGNALEYYDFTVYGFLTLVIGKLFFPTAGSYQQLLLAIASFGVGFVMRPLGGVVIGAYADRKGRKRAMTLTIFMMALGCLTIALVPTYVQIGIAAPVMVVLARLLQGFSAGGEMGASTALLVEHVSPSNRGYAASWQFASQGLGVLCGALIVAALTSSLTSAQMLAWGWRIPFVLGLVIAPVGLLIRSRIDDPPGRAGRATAASTEPERSSLSVVCTDHLATVIQAITTLIGVTTLAYVVTFYLPTYAIRELGMAPFSAFLGAVMTGVLTCVLSPLVGKWSDRVGRKSLIVWSRIVVAILIYPMFFWMLASPVPGVLFTVVCLLSVALVVQGVPSITMLPEMFPKQVRVTGMSIVYSVGVAIFGGFAPLVNAWLVKATSSRLAPAGYLLTATLVSLLGLMRLKDQTGRDIDQSDGFGKTHSNTQDEKN
jgi:MHS family proline/betaine transporter-like MFS transporter